MFTTIIVQPIFNLLVFIYAILPGHNFGLALILFTIVVRLLLWPLVKKQLHQTKKMRAIQPELKRIKKEAKGDRQKESMLLMELYKERGINPIGALGPVILQLPILIGLYIGLQKIITDNNQLIHFSYPFVQDLPWMQHLAQNIKQFDSTLFGIVDLTRPALSSGNVYIPGLIIVLGSALIQFFTSRQLLPQDKDARSLRAILKEAGSGKQTDQSEVNAAVGRSTLYILPAFIILFTINLPSLLGLYWLVGGIVAYIQQRSVLGTDEAEMEALADGKVLKNVDDIPEAEVVTTKPAPKKKPAKKKRRK
ncbi:MAG: hypothetical protein JWM37_232 [Candidatus Saccharibacteria bacterium]|nr:hypothetical protein [Candidatus Saccharibacteria bacterium]